MTAALPVLTFRRTGDYVCIGSSIGDGGNGRATHLPGPSVLGSGSAADWTTARATDVLCGEY